MLPEVEVKEEGGDDGTDLEEKVTFLRGPMRSARRDIYGTTPSRTYGDVPKILPRVKANWGKTLAHWAIQLEVLGRDTALIFVREIHRCGTSHALREAEVDVKNNNNNNNKKSQLGKSVEREGGTRTTWLGDSLQGTNS
ncbi:hypothetical protein SMACR_04526 [Sordaria macrospora]|uniref:Uncharacterized protein n=1 Tax=Sordaria macrospora TaxID=5147 RepID=A0A8S8ZJA2_SORMA|nr:hypothetical protein SMACR_04526 [Sordaria macrospora]WPJ62745.1 hypothetical protein SMAC4_04526 [Sordaria macrospora]